MLSLPIASPSEEREIPRYTGSVEEDLRRVSRARLAERITGGLSFTSKMPCPSWGISATRCKIGSLLAEQRNTTCSDCYARKGRYLFPNVQRKLEERYQGLFDPLWTPAMIFLIRWYCERYFRFFDSGDLQSQSHLQNIATIAENVPDVQLWLPTREAEIVRRVGKMPPNLIVRVSAARINGRAPSFPYTSTVVTDGETCPASEQGNLCGNCRGCWDPTVQNVAYRLH